MDPAALQVALMLGTRVQKAQLALERPNELAIMSEGL